VGIWPAPAQPATTGTSCEGRPALRAKTLPNPRRCCPRCRRHQRRCCYHCHCRRSHDHCLTCGDWSSTAGWVEKRGGAHARNGVGGGGLHNNTPFHPANCHSFGAMHAHAPALPTRARRPAAHSRIQVLVRIMLRWVINALPLVGRPTAPQPGSCRPLLRHTNGCKAGRTSHPSPPRPRPPPTPPPPPADSTTTIVRPHACHNTAPRTGTQHRSPPPPPAPLHLRLRFFRLLLLGVRDCSCATSSANRTRRGPSP
jgi:hypothetical protein